MISLKDLRVSDLDPLRSLEPGALVPRHQAGEPFLRGPIPLAWLAKAATVPGAEKALAVATVLWFLVGVEGGAKVQIRPSLMRAFNVDRHAEYRALKAMETVKLIMVDRKRGRAAIVTLLSCHNDLTRGA